MDRTHEQTNGKIMLLSHTLSIMRVDGGGDMGIRGAGDGGKGGRDRGRGGGERGKRGRGSGNFGVGVIPKFVVFYLFYSNFMYLNAITGYQKYITDVFKQIQAYLQ